ESRPERVLGLVELRRRDAVRADAVELDAQQAVEPIRRHALIDNAVCGPDAWAVARPERIQERAGAHRCLLAAHVRDIQPRALALADDDVEDLEGRGIGVAVLR